MIRALGLEISTRLPGTKDTIWIQEQDATWMGEASEGGDAPWNWCQAWLGSWRHDFPMINTCFDELKDVFIWFYTTEKKITFGIREHEANEDFQVWRISSWMVYFLPSPVEFPRNARRFWGQCRWASRLGRQDFWHSVGCIMDPAGHVEILGSSRGLPWFHRPWRDVLMVGGIVDVWWVLRLSYVKHDWRWL